jgi:hypothetical protein
MITPVCGDNSNVAGKDGATVKFVGFPPSISGFKLMERPGDSRLRKPL